MDATGQTDNQRIGGGRAPTKALAVLLVLVGVFAACYLVWWGLQPQVKQTVRVPDGSVVSLAAVTHGTVHRFDPAPPLFRLARGLKLPREIPEVATLTTAKQETRL